MLTVLLAVFAAGAGPFERLKAKAAVERVSINATAAWAGRYTSTPKELGGALSGDELYLFPDGTYIYCEWADIEPLTIYDKGQWSAVDGLIRLRSGPEIQWPPGAEREFIAAQRPGHSKEILLVGTQGKLSYFEDNAADDPQLMLLIVGLLREETLDQREGETVRARLMKESWRPDYFRKGAAR